MEYNGLRQPRGLVSLEFNKGEKDSPISQNRSTRKVLFLRSVF